MIEISYELLLSLNIGLLVIAILLAIWLLRFAKWWETDKKASIAMFLSFTLIGAFVTGGWLLEYPRCSTCSNYIKAEYCTHCEKDEAFNTSFCNNCGDQIINGETLNG